MGKGQSNDPLRAPSSSSTLPLRLTRQTGLGGIGREWWSMHASQGRVRSRGSVSSQRPAPGLDARASTTAATTVAVQSWMTILLFVAQISLSTCYNTNCGGRSYKCQASDCVAGKYQLGGHPETVAFALTYLIHVRATCGMEHASVAACRRGQLVQQRRG